MLGCVPTPRSSPSQGIERIAVTATNTMSSTLGRLRTLAGGFMVATVLVAVATFATGWWVFANHRTGWLIIGGALCAIPAVAAILARLYVGATAKAAPRLLGDVTQMIRESRVAAGPLIDHDTGKPLGASAKSFRDLRSTLKSRRLELPALFAGVRAITSVPGLLAIALLFTLAVGALGTVLLLVGLFR